MTNGVVQLAIFCAVIVALTPIIGGYMFRVYTGERTFLTPVLAPVERVLYRLIGVNPDAGQHWTRYALSMLLLHFVGLFVFYMVLRLQDVLPLNPRDVPAFDPALAFSTAASFVTNTDWQAYSGETQISYLSQMIAITVQNFLSAGIGMAIAIAVIRGFVGRQIKTLGNFYVDLTRSVLYILLPIAIISSIVMVWQGTPQNFSDYVTAETLEGGKQVIAQGPVASQASIKMLGTNGGGFFNANNAHPYENPTPITNFLQLVLVLLIPAGLTYTFGKMAGNTRQGWAIFSAMGVLFVLALVTVYWAETQGNPLLSNLPIDQAGNMEGKEVRFGVANSALSGNVTTVTSAGAPNSMHDSFTPIGGFVLLMNIHIGEIIFGGVGSGLFGMMYYVLLTVFLAGLMVGRSPEYLGKKIEAKEIKLSMLALFTLTIGMIGVPALAIILPSSSSSIQHAGPHGLSELLYAYGSATGNNGSSFAGFNSGTPFHLTAMGLCMLLGRFGFSIPILAIAGTLGAKRTALPSANTFSTHTPLFVGLLIGVIFIIGGLTIFPALALGPLAEFFEMLAGHSF
ncbi:MAG: potassium-transporting ATPase subunit KdpA [Alphaproteobacteria bacterium]